MKENTVPGLYDKATQILNHNQTVSDADSGAITFDSKSGISQEDQKDIVRNINEIMQSNKIKVTSDVFRIKAKKKGTGLPFLVNLISFVVLAGVVFVLWFAFRLEETKIAGGEGGAGSEAQKEIIEEQKKRAQEELNKKNQEILGIQTNLEKVNSDLSSLKENMTSEIAAKEKAFKDRYEQELEAERKKLLAAGTASAEVDKKIRELEALQTRQLQIEMTSFKRDMESQVQNKERELLDQRKEFNVRLETATSDRKKLKDAYEAELRKSEEQLAEEEQKTRRLTAQKEKFDLINEQIVGFYRLVQEDIGAARYPAAQKRLQDLRDYLGQPAIRAIPEVSRRYDVELFVIDSLEQLTSSTAQRSDAEVQSAQAEAKIVTEIRKLVLAADEAYRAGNKTRADGLYLQALELIPEINKSHEYFLGRVNEIEAYRKSQVASLVDAASAQFRNKQFTEALVTYGKALEYLPTDRNTARILEEIKAAGFEAGNGQAGAQAVKAAEAQIKTGNERLQKAAYDEAIAAYLGVLKDSSRLPNAAEAASQLDKAVRLKDEAFSAKIAGLESNSSSGLTEYNKQIAQLQAEVKDRQAKLDALSGGQGELAKSLAEEQKKRSAAETEVARLEALSKDQAAKLSAASGDKDSLAKDLADTQKKLAAAEAEKARFEALSNDYKKLQTEYAAYTRNEDSVVGGRSLEEMALGKSYLDTFLSSSTVKSAFPGILQRIQAYDRAFEQAGRASALQETIDILKAAGRLNTKEEKIAFLRKKQAEAKPSDPTAVLLKSLIDLISG